MYPASQPIETLVIGAGITGLSAAYRLHQEDKPFLLLEASHRTGGLIHTETEAGYLLEGGPNTFPSTASEMIGLCEDLNLLPIPANPAANKRYLYLNQKLTALPQKPWQAFTTPVLSLAGKLRALGEPFRVKCRADDMSVAGFFKHRLGREVAENLVDPFISGIYAGNVETLSLAAVFPKLWEWEQTSGSLWKGFQNKSKHPAADPHRPKPKLKLLSFEGGLQTLTDALTQALPTEQVRLNTPVLDIQKEKSNAYVVTLQTGETLLAQNIILAVPAHIAARLVKSFMPEGSYNLERIPYSGLSVAHLGFEKAHIKHPLDGFGCLIPRKENIKLLGTIWASSLFPQRAPDDKILLSNFIGGAHHPEVVREKASQVERQITWDLQRVFGLRGSLEPQFRKVFVYEKAIPQYNLGHIQRIATIEAKLQKHKGLYLAGNYLRGIALNECVKSGQLAADQIIG